MRNVILLFILIVFIACKLNKSIVPEAETCKGSVLNKLERLSKLVVSENNVYTLKYDEIDVPAGYDTIKWHMETGEILTFSGFDGDSLHTQNMIFRSELKKLVVTEDSCKLNKVDLIQILGVPSAASTGKSKYNSIYYHFNNKRYPECYDNEQFDSSKFGDCSFLVFNFDSTDKLESVNTLFLYP